MKVQEANDITLSPVKPLKVNKKLQINYFAL